MRERDTYELVFAHPELTPPTEDVIMVHRTEAKGAGGHPVYMDDTGIVRAEISDRDEVRMIASGGHQEPSHAVQARPTA